MRQNQFRQSSLFFMTTTFIITILLFVFDIIVWTNSTTKKMKDATSFFNNYITFYVLYLMVVTQELFFWHIVFFLKIRISNLNKSLQCLGKEILNEVHKKLSVQDFGGKTRLRQILVGGTLDKIEQESSSRTSRVGKVGLCKRTFLSIL